MGAPSTAEVRFFFFVHQTLFRDGLGSVFLPEMRSYDAGGLEKCTGGSLSSKNSWRTITLRLGGRVTIFFWAWMTGSAVGYVKAPHKGVPSQNAFLRYKKCHLGFALAPPWPDLDSLCSRGVIRGLP